MQLFIGNDFVVDPSPFETCFNIKKNLNYQKGEKKGDSGKLRIISVNNSLLYTLNSLINIFHNFQISIKIPRQPTADTPFKKGGQNRFTIRI